MTSLNSASIGTVYGALLNDRATQERLADAFQQPPYKAAPVAPVLYVKPRNTFAADGFAVVVPAVPGQVRIDATVGAVIGRRACRVSEQDALAHVAGYRIVSDVTLPHESYYRPSIHLRCRDGFCPMGEVVSPQGFDLGTVDLVVKVNGQQVHHRSFSTLVRSLPRLIADVTEFMTLEAGDVLLVGPPEGAPLAGPGDQVEIEVAGLGVLRHGLASESKMEAGQ